VGVASLVLGIISIIFGLFGFHIVSLPCGIVGIILGAVGKADPKKAGVAQAGLVCSIIGTILSLILFVACVACFSALSAF
jgi:hypothetical protein